MIVPCAQCNEPVDVADMPQPQIMNTLGASLILLEHPKPAFCLHCKAPVSVQLIGANLHLKVVPIQPQQPEGIVLASSMPRPSGN